MTNQQRDKQRKRYFSLFFILVFVFLIMLSGIDQPFPARAAILKLVRAGAEVRAPAPEVISSISDNLVWKPYLQQLSDTGVIILWTTKTGATPIVEYSIDTGYSLSAGGSSRKLSVLGTQLHRVELTGLQPNTTYFYKVYTDGQDLLPDEVLSFQTAPLTGSHTPFTFLAFGDYGLDNNSQKQLRDQMLLDSFNFILTTGDNAYKDGTYGEFDKKVFQIYKDIFSRAGIFPALGNHDYHTNEGAPYLDLFELPRNAWRAGDIERYYSFDYGNVHFVALDTKTPFNVNDSAASDDMFDWLRADLSQTTQPWKIVAFHYPAYSSGTMHGSNSQVQTKIVPILETYEVNLVLNGHDHIYQRIKPLRGGQITTVEEGGIVYLVSGAGARANYGCSSASWSAIEYCSQNYGLYARITVNGNHMRIEAIDEDGAIKDLYLLNNGLPDPPTATPTSGLPENTPTATSTSVLPENTPTVAPGLGSIQVYLPVVFKE